MRISANTCTLSVLKPPNEAELMCQFLRQSCCHCVQPAFVSGTRGVFSLGECWSAELLRCGVSKEPAVFQSCKALPVSASQPFQKLKQKPWIGVKEQAEYPVCTARVWGMAASGTCHLEFRFCESVSVAASWWQGVSSCLLLWG